MKCIIQNCNLTAKYIYQENSYCEAHKNMAEIETNKYYQSLRRRQYSEKDRELIESGNY